MWLVDRFFHPIFIFLICIYLAFVKVNFGGVVYQLRFFPMSILFIGLIVYLAVIHIKKDKSQKTGWIVATTLMIPVTFSLFVMMVFWNPNVQSSTAMTFNQAKIIFPGSEEEKAIFTASDGRVGTNCKKQLIRIEELEENSVLVFFKLNCSKCQKSIPAILDQIGDKSGIRFIDMNTDSGKQLANNLGVTTASTAILVKNGKAKRVALSIVDKDKIKVNQKSIDTIRMFLEKG